MAEIRYFKIDMMSFFAVGGSIWMKFDRQVQNDMPTEVIWTKWKPEVKFQYGRRLFFETGNSYIISQL